MQALSNALQQLGLPAICAPDQNSRILARVSLSARASCKDELADVQDDWVSRGCLAARTPQIQEPLGVTSLLRQFFVCTHHGSVLLLLLQSAPVVLLQTPCKQTHFVSEQDHACWVLIMSQKDADVAYTVTFIESFCFLLAQGSCRYPEQGAQHARAIFARLAAPMHAFMQLQSLLATRLIAVLLQLLLRNAVYSSMSELQAMKLTQHRLPHTVTRVAAFSNTIRSLGAKTNLC